MSRGSKFLIKYRAINYGWAYLVALVIFLVLSILVNFHDWLHGDFNGEGLLGGIAFVVFIASYVMLLITPGRYFKTANVLGISRRTIFKTDILTPLVVSLVEVLLIVPDSNPDFGSHGWLGLMGIIACLTIGANYFCQMVGDAIALVHGKWKWVVMIAIPVSFMTILVWAMFGLAKLMNSMNFQNSRRANLALIHTLENGWLWLGILVIGVVIITAINWQLVKHFHIMRD